ncbi:nucleoside hydrolase-like [Sitodiplosis mosellana]|uniref:nucleoside hydrolase-like n=1 Tax=Sitodiplosis mosellana TaxID=263140 RepID=UPI00244424D4|nr:nucleoside hydrolase-like [Sitodiplosis mosellana]
MSSGTKPNYVIFDTDMGSDDAWALQMILKAEKVLKSVKVLAITTVNGNTTNENVIKNTYRILDGFDRTDIPIYKGADEALIPGDIKRGSHGANGFADVEFWDLDKYPSDINTLIQRKRAIEIIRDLVMEHPNEITLICVGPLTNIALAIKSFSEIKTNIKEAMVLGGNHQGIGSIKPCADFNFYMDPEAAHIVLNSLTCPITTLPLECGLVQNLNIPLDWRFNVLANVNANDKNLTLLNEIERIRFRGRLSYVPYDALLTAVFLFPERCIRTKNQCNATVELHGSHTRGQTVIDRRNSNYNVTIIEQVYEEEFKNSLVWTVSE